MSGNTAEQQLHDRATRGETLSAEERAHLQEWYARLDHEEGAILDRSVTHRIQALTSENAALRREIASLQALLAQKSTPQPA